MSIVSYIKDCSKEKVAGNYHKVFVGLANKVDGKTFTGDTKILTELTMDINSKMKILEGQIDGVQRTHEGEGTRGYFTNQEIIVRFERKNPELERTVESLIKLKSCGLFLIVVDNTGQGWVSGIAPASEYFKNKPFYSINDEFDSGESVEDAEDGNVWAVTFQRNSGTREYGIEASMVESLVEENADFVDWPA